jgi:transposase
MLHPKMKHIYVGMDIHKRKHTAVIINCFSEKLGEITIENNIEGFGKLLEEVSKHYSKGITPLFGLEDTTSNGRSLAAFLLNKKYAVKSIDSTLTHSERKNRPIAHKTDSFDSLCIARVLLNRLDELPNAVIDDRGWTLKLLVSRRNSIVKTRAALKNQVHAHIKAHYPSYERFFNSMYCKSAMEFWRNYPSPLKLKGVDSETLGKLLKEHSSGFFGIEKAEEILKLVAKDGDTTSGHQERRDFIISQCIDEINHCDEEADKITKEIKAIMALYPYKLETLPGVELVTAAMLVSEIGDIGRFANAGKLACYSGISPVTCSSGEKDRKFRNRQGNRDLYNIFHDLAARSINNGRNRNTPVNSVFYHYYHKKLKDGKTEHQAIVCVMRQLVNIVFGMMKHQREYIKPILLKNEARENT